MLTQQIELPTSNKLIAHFSHENDFSLIRLSVNVTPAHMLFIHQTFSVVIV